MQFPLFCSPFSPFHIKLIRKNMQIIHIVDQYFAYLEEKNNSSTYVEVIAAVTVFDRS